MMTRNDYMNDPRRLNPDNSYNETGAKQVHHEYYAQFVTSATKHLVATRFGIKRLRDAYATDENMNNIPLKEWDNIEHIVKALTPAHLLKEAGEGWSSCTSVCIAKCAARILINENKEN